MPDSDEAYVAEDNGEGPVRKEMRATQARVRMAQRLLALLMAASAPSAKSDEMTDLNIEGDTPWVWIAAIITTLVVIICLCSCVLCMTCYYKRDNEKFYKRKFDEVKECLLAALGKKANDEAEREAMRVMIRTQADEIKRLHGNMVKIKELETHLEALFQDFERRGKTIKKYEDALTAAEKTNKDMQKDIKEKNDELDKNEKLIADSKADMERMQGELRMLRGRKSPSRKRMRSAGTQSQCTYRRDLATPQFQKIQAALVPAVSTSEEFTASTLQNDRPQ